MPRQPAIRFFLIPDTDTSLGRFRRMLGRGLEVGTWEFEGEETADAEATVENALGTAEAKVVVSVYMVGRGCVVELLASGMFGTESPVAAETRDGSENDGAGMEGDGQRDE